MKIRPVILCGGAGNRLWPNSKKDQAKQFINFGGWSLLEKTLDRIKSPIYDYPILSTNLKYLKNIKLHLKKSKIKKYKIILEPSKRNTAAAILTSSLIKDIPNEQPVIFFPADHLIEKVSLFNKIIFKNKFFLSDKNILIFGVKPTFPSSEFGYFITKKNTAEPNKVLKFIEKPTEINAKKVIKNGGHWNSGIFFFRKDSIVNSFKKYQPRIYNNCLMAIKKAEIRNNIYYLNNNFFSKVPSKSFDYAILEKTKLIYGIKLNLSWSDLGSWKEILKMYGKNKFKFFKKKKVYHRPWGYYVNLFEGKNFLIKELTINANSSISLQKHLYRSEHWLITQGKPKITIDKKIFFKEKDEAVYIPKGSIHRIENQYKKPVKIMEAQTGSVLKESDIIRFKDIYGRAK